MTSFFFFFFFCYLFYLASMLYTYFSCTVLAILGTSQFHLPTHWAPCSKSTALHNIGLAMYTSRFRAQRSGTECVRQVIKKKLPSWWVCLKVHFYLTGSLINHHTHAQRRVTVDIESVGLSVCLFVGLSVPTKSQKQQVLWRQNVAYGQETMNSSKVMN